MSAHPFSAVEWLLAGRYLRAKKQESFVSVIAGFSFIGIALGVATLIIVMAVMNGFRHELLGRILGINGHFLIQSYDSAGIRDFDDAIARLKAIPGVTRAAPYVEGQVLANAGGVSLGALVRGFRTEDIASLEAVAETLADGTLDRFAEGGVILGVRLAQRLGVGPGMAVTLIAPQGDVTPFGTTPRRKTYRVAGTFAIGMVEYDSTFIFMPLAEAQPFFNYDGAAQAIEIMVEDPDRVAQWFEPIRQTAPENTRLLDWQRINEGFFSALMVERNVMFLILSLIILVAALNTISGLIMLVKDKGRDIAILRTMGLTKGGVMRVFFIAGSAIGFAGTILGLVLGILVCLNIESIRQFMSWLSGVTLFNPEIYFLSQLPARMETGETIAVAIMSMTLAFLATLYPSWRAARLDPVEALRYE